jgi:hypothetical protein
MSETITVECYYAAICRHCHKRVVVPAREPSNPSEERSVRCGRCATTNSARPMMDPEDDSNHAVSIGYGGKHVAPRRELLVDRGRDDVVTFDGGACNV